MKYVLYLNEEFFSFRVLLFFEYFNYCINYCISTVLTCAELDPLAVLFGYLRYKSRFDSKVDLIGEFGSINGGGGIRTSTSSGLIYEMVK